MKLAVRVALLALALSPALAFGDAAPRITVATPGVSDGSIQRYTLRFSEPMVALGDPRAAAPVDVTCTVAGQGRWADQQTYVWEFATPLPGGTKCELKVKDGLKSVAGYAMLSGQTFTVDAGGPVARAVLPGSSSNDIEEGQIFLVAANMPATAQSVAANAYCSVEGLGEKIPVDVLASDTAAKILGEMGSEDNYTVRSFLEEGGMPADIPVAAEDRQKMLAGVTALKCRRPLPPGHDMALIWSGKIAGAGGKLAGADQRFDYKVREKFAVRFECSRVNPQAGCNPVEQAHLRFTAPIAMSLAKQIKVTTADGKTFAPVFDADEQKSATISDITFPAPMPYSTAAKVSIPAGINDESGRPLTNPERFPLDIRFDAAPPLVKFAAGFGILEAKEGGILPVTVRNVEPMLQGKQLPIGGQTLKVDASSDGKIADWLRKVDSADDNDVQDITDKAGNTVRQIQNTGSKSILGGSAGGRPMQISLPGKGKDFEVVGIPLTQPGFYIVELASPVLGNALLGRNAPRYVASAALVTNMTVHFKWGREQSLAWVTSLDTGTPVGGAAVAVTDSCTGQLLANGTTDKSGAVFIPSGLPQPETYGDCDGDAANHPLMISARAGDDFSFTMTEWGEGIRPYDFDLNYGYEKPGEILHTVFDRALVRQGETIHMKHILRQPGGGGFALTPGFTGTLRLSHRGSDTQFDLPLTIDANGIGETEWAAPKGAPMGDYDISVINGDKTISTDQSFKVDEYKLPTMRATVTGPKGAAILPKTLPLDLFVGYLAGGGASNLPVELRVGWFGRSATPEGYDSYTFGGAEVKEGTKPLNGEGEEDTEQLPPTQTIPSTLGGDGTAKTNVQIPALENGADMLVEMDYQDANGEVLTASKRIPIFSSGVQLGVKTDGWLMKQDDLRLNFVALDTDGKPKKGQTVSVALYSRQVLTARRRLIGGFYAYDNQMTTKKLGGSCQTSTDELGLARCTIDPGVSGEVYIVATTRDADGNIARATRSVWLAGDDDWWFGGDNGDRMDLVPEKLAYKAGETARFQVRMPFREAEALVTVEREGVLSSFVTKLSGENPVVEVAMPASYAPDVFVSVMAVRGRAKPGAWSLFEGLGRSLGLSKAPDEAREATALIDLAKPSYRLGIAKVKVGWEGHQLGVTVKANKERYAARDTALVDVSVKSPDGKPAKTAEIAFAAVDQALLQLAPNESWQLLDAMMGDRPISVLTSTAQTQVVGRRHYGKKAVEAGGGGGGDLSGLNRENFQPVLLWKGRVALDANGHAQVPVQLNDALTSFKLVAIATDGPQLFGTGMADIRTAQDLSIYAGMPALVRTGDEFAAAFTLRNGSDKPMTVTANVDLQPAIAKGNPLTVTIPAGGAMPIAWNLTAPAQSGQLKWTVSAKSSDGKAVDKITTTQDVIFAVPTEVWSGTLARVGTNTSIQIAPPAGALPGRGVVDIKLDDSLAPPLTGVRAYMTAYPYNCFEQRLSRIVALGDSGGWNALAGEIPTYQAEDGLLRYWPMASLKGSESLTAYVLSLTSDAGLPIPATARTKMIEGLKAVLDGRLRHEDYGDYRLQKLGAFNALARAGAATPAMLSQIGMNAQDMPTASLADYLVALDKVPGLANGTALKTQAQAELRKRLVYEGTRLDLSDQDKSAWWLMSSGDEAAIKAVIATLGRPGWNDDAAKMMVGVSLRQSRGHWDTTTANAWGAIAARKFGGLYPASAITGSTSLVFGMQTISKAWPLAPEARTASFPLSAASTPLVLTQAGGAGPWATVTVSAAVPLTQPLFAGYKVTKKVEAVTQRVKGQWTRGDVIKVTITVEASAERNWVVINDPIPAGATIIGDAANQSTLLNADTTNGGTSYVERGRDAWKGYFAWMPAGSSTVSYTMRLNGYGSFSMPATRVEAMYSPSINAQLPNARMTIADK